MKARVNLTLDAALWERFRIRAIQEKTSGSATIDKLMGEYLERATDAQESRRAARGQRKNRATAQFTGRTDREPAPLSARGRGRAHKPAR